MIITGITVDQFKLAVERAGHEYSDNLKAEIGTEHSRTRFNGRVLPITTGYQMGLPTSELAPGQKRSWQGRRTNAVCWHVYRDVLLEVFHINPQAKVRTMYAKYLGVDGFLNEYPKTAWINVGSQYKPMTPIDLCDHVTNLTGVIDFSLLATLDPVRHKPARDEQEMIDWWAAQRDRVRSRR